MATPKKSSSMSQAELRRYEALRFAFQWAHGTYESTDTLIGQAEFYAEYLKSGKVPE